ncbi:MAG: polysaccharide biosynthesis/export family protein [Pyrinomonadaceae bacterium]
MQGQSSKQADESRPTVAQRTYKIAKIADVSSRLPTDIYKVGVGDVLSVNLKNAAQGSGYFTVRQDGTIDFPLAGENVIIADQTVDIIEDILEFGVTRFPDPQIEVRVREYVSHRIKVSGLVEKLRREEPPARSDTAFCDPCRGCRQPKSNESLINWCPST